MNLSIRSAFPPCIHCTCLSAFRAPRVLLKSLRVRYIIYSFAALCITRQRLWWKASQVQVHLYLRGVRCCCDSPRRRRRRDTVKSSAYSSVKCNRFIKLVCGARAQCNSGRRPERAKQSRAGVRQSGVMIAARSNKISTLNNTCCKHIIRAKAWGCSPRK